MFFFSAPLISYVDLGTLSLHDLQAQSACLHRRSAHATVRNRLPRYRDVSSGEDRARGRQPGCFGPGCGFPLATRTLSL